MHRLVHIAVICGLLGAAVPAPALASRPPAAAARALVAAAAARVTATVATGGGTLQLRAGPATADAVVGQLADGSRIAVSCQVFSQQIGSALRRTGYWDRLPTGRYLSDAYVRWRPYRPGVHWCGVRGEPVVSVAAGAGGPVNVRRGPGISHPVVDTLPTGRVFHVYCQAWGERASGPSGRSNAWNYVGARRYVSNAVAVWRPSRPTLPWCGQVPPTVPAATPGLFVARVVRSAQQGFRQYRVPASVTIAQAILESGWGRSGLSRRDHNYFGIKCFGTPGRFALGCRAYPTTECGGGRCWRTVATFRAYRNATGSMTDHGYFLVSNRRYQAAFRHTGNPNRFAIEIHKAGYATSPTYAAKIIGLMKKYDLYRFDL